MSNSAMDASAAVCAPLLARAFRDGVADGETAAALRQVWGDKAVLVVSLAAPVSAHDVLGTSSLLDEGQLRTGIVPLHGTAAGSTMLASEPAVFDLDTPQRLQDLQCLHLRYRAVSFLCVPIPRPNVPLDSGLPSAAGPAPPPAAGAAADAPSCSSTAAGSAAASGPAPSAFAAAAAAGAPAGMLVPSGPADVPATAVANAPAVGTLTLGFSYDVRQMLLSPLLEMNAIAAALAPLLVQVTAEAHARHLATRPDGDSSDTAVAAVQAWQDNSVAPEVLKRAEMPTPRPLVLDDGASESDSATAAEVCNLLRDGDSWLYESSWGSYSSQCRLAGDAPTPRHTPPKPLAEVARRLARDQALAAAAAVADADDDFEAVSPQAGGVAAAYAAAAAVGAHAAPDGGAAAAAAMSDVEAVEDSAMQPAHAAAAAAHSLAGAVVATAGDATASSVASHSAAVADPFAAAIAAGTTPASVQMNPFANAALNSANPFARDSDQRWLNEGADSLECTHSDVADISSLEVGGSLVAAAPAVAAAKSLSSRLSSGNMSSLDEQGAEAAREQSAAAVATRAHAAGAPTNDGTGSSGSDTLSGERTTEGGAGGFAARRQAERSTAKDRRRLSREDSRRLVDLAMHMCTAETGAAGGAAGSSATSLATSLSYGVAHASDSSGTSSPMRRPEGGSAESVFRRPSSSAGAFAIKVDTSRGSLDAWPLTSRLVSPLPAPGTSVSSDAQRSSGEEGDVATSSHGTAAAAQGAAAAAFEADLEAEIWAAEADGRKVAAETAAAAAAADAAAAVTAAAVMREDIIPAFAAGSDGTRPAAADGCPADWSTAANAGVAADAQEAAEAALPLQLQSAGLRFADTTTEMQFVQWHGLQAQKMDCMTLVILLVMWCALGLPPMGLWWKSTPLWAMYALGTLWAAAFYAHQRHPVWYLRNREAVLQTVNFCSLAFGCLNKHIAAEIAAHKLAAAGSWLQTVSAYFWLQRAFLMEAMAVFPLLLWVRVRRALPVQTAILAIVAAQTPTTCSTCFSGGSTAYMVCSLSGNGLLVLVGTVAPLAFMWVTEHRSRQTFAWRLRGKNSSSIATSKEGSWPVIGSAEGGAAADTGGTAADVNCSIGGRGGAQDEGDVVAATASAAVA